MDVNESENVIATCRDTMLTMLEKFGGQSLILSWTRHDGSTVKLALAIRENDQNTVADCIRNMDDEEMAHRLVPIVMDEMCKNGLPGEDDARCWLEQPESILQH